MVNHRNEAKVVIQIPFIPFACNELSIHYTNLTKTTRQQIIECFNDNIRMPFCHPLRCVPSTRSLFIFSQAAYTL